MRFKYSFQKIVDLKSNEKTQAEWYLSNAVTRLRQEETGLDSLHQEKEHLQSHVQKVSADSTTVSELMLCQTYMNHINHCIVDKHQDVRKAQEQVESQKQYLTDKMKEEKVWQKAREHSLHLFNQSMNRIEQNQLDEMVTNRHRHLS